MAFPSPWPLLADGELFPPDANVGKGHLGGQPFIAEETVKLARTQKLLEFLEVGLGHLSGLEIALDASLLEDESHSQHVYCGDK